MRTALEWVLETTSAPLLLASEEGRIVRANGHVERAFGYPRSGLVGVRFDALVSASCREAVDARLRELLAQPEASKRASLDALVALRNDGSEFEATLNLEVVRHEGHCLVAVEFIEAAATASLEKFAMALDDAPTGMLLVDNRGLILYVNGQTERLFGYERGALVGEAIERLVPARSRARHVDLRNEFSKNAQTRAMGAGQDLYGVRRDGSEVPVEIGLSAVTLDGRRCVLSSTDSPGSKMVLTSVIDVTERQLAERALRHSEARHRELFNNSPVALLEQDYSEVRAYVDSLHVSDPGALMDVLCNRPDAVITAMEKVATLTANEQALALFEVDGISDLYPLRDLLTEEAIDWFRRAVCELYQGKRQFGGETRVRTRRGNIKVVNTRIHVVSGHQGTWSGIVASIFDLTAHKQAEDSLRASLREKEVLLREVHHRVKNNLQIVSSLLNLKADSLHDPAMQQVFADCQDRVRSLAILHEHLYTSRDLSNVSISSYIRTLLEHLRQSLRSPRRAISLGVEVAEIGLALDDAIPCGLIVNELVTNALKHAFPGRRNGCILVCLRALDTGELELMVSDDGVGLPLGAEPGPASLGSSGLDLVFTFVEQLRAHVEICRIGGTRFSVRFTPTPWASKRSA